MKNADVIHLHSSKAGFLGRLACRMLGMQNKVVYSPHGVSFIRKDISDFKVALFTFLEKTGAKFGGRVIGSGASEATAFTAVGIAAEHINSGIACEEQVADRPCNAPMIIGTAARITHQKNPALFNEIAQSFASDPSVRFLWIGDGELRQQLSAPNIEITGWTPRDVLIQHLHNLDVYLSTSLWEGMPLSVLLAMCAGKPLVLYDCVGNRDLVEDKKGGFTFREKEEAISCIETLKADMQLVREMGEFSHRRLLDNFHLDAMICHYIELYEAVGKENSMGTG
jgi:glycosyltransferase involved in cell wall biosynthesis